MFAVLQAAQTGNCKQLTSEGPFRKKALLSRDQEEDLTRKLEHGEFECAKDVAEWFGGPVAMSTVHGWCQRLGKHFGFSFRQLRQSNRPRIPRVPRPRSLHLGLSQKDVEALRARQVVERQKLGIESEELRDPDQAGNPRQRTNPVLRIEATLRVASGQSISRIAQELNTSRSEIRRWVRLFVSGGIDGLCFENQGGRPCIQKAAESTQPAEVKSGQLEDMERRNSGDGQASTSNFAETLANLQVHLKKMEEEARMKKAEVEKQQAILDEEWRSSPYYTP